METKIFYAVYREKNAEQKILCSLLPQLHIKIWALKQDQKNMPKCYDGPLAFENEIADNFYYLFILFSIEPNFFTSCTVTLAIKKSKEQKQVTL